MQQRRLRLGELQAIQSCTPRHCPRQSRAALKSWPPGRFRSIWRSWPICEGNDCRLICRKCCPAWISFARPPPNC